MGQAGAGKDTKTVAFTSGGGSNLGSLSKSDVYSASSETVTGNNSISATNGHNALDASAFGDEAENVILGKKTGEWSLEGNYTTTSGDGLATLKDASDNGDKVEIGFIVDETVASSTDSDGYEMTVFVTEFSMDSDDDDKVGYSATLQCADGDGWNPLT